MIKRLQLVRGSYGYGFTVTGECPCSLNGVSRGSPADLAGCQTGDHVIRINGVDVSSYSHDDVVSLIGSGTGSLDLEVFRGMNDGHLPDRRSHSRTRVSRYKEVIPQEDVQRATKHTVITREARLGVQARDVAAYVHYIGTVTNVGGGALAHSIRHLQNDRPGRLLHMNIVAQGIQLKDEIAIITVYPLAHIITSEASPNDPRFFGIMVQPESSTVASHAVFKIDPELVDHSVHVPILNHYGYQCSPLHCSHFLTTCVPLVNAIAHMHVPYPTHYPPSTMVTVIDLPMSNSTHTNDHRLNPRAMPDPDQTNSLRRSMQRYLYDKNRDIMASSDDEEEVDAPPVLVDIPPRKAALTVPLVQPARPKSTPPVHIDEKEETKSQLAIHSSPPRVTLPKPRKSESLESVAVQQPATTTPPQPLTVTEKLAYWRTNKPAILADPEGLTLLHKFLKRQYCTENLDFLIEVDIYKDITILEDKEVQKKLVLSQFITEDSSRTVNIDHIARAHILDHQQENRDDLFEVAVEQVKKLLISDCLPRFFGPGNAEQLERDVAQLQVDAIAPAAETNAVLIEGLPPKGTGKSKKSKGQKKENFLHKVRTFISSTSDSNIPSKVRGAATADMEDASQPIAVVGIQLSSGPVAIIACPQSALGDVCAQLNISTNYITQRNTKIEMRDVHGSWLSDKPSDDVMNAFSAFMLTAASSFQGYPQVIKLEPGRRKTTDGFTKRLSSLFTSKSKQEQLHPEVERLARDITHMSRLRLHDQRGTGVDPTSLQPPDFLQGSSLYGSDVSLTYSSNSDPSLSHHDTNFSHDGIIPSPDHATNYFRMSGSLDGGLGELANGDVGMVINPAAGASLSSLRDGSTFHGLRD